MRILIVTDAWDPQVNGVVRTLKSIIRECESLGHDIHVVEPTQFRNIPCPTYPEIRLALSPSHNIEEALKHFAPDAIHISTEGPLGWSARRICMKRGLPFTTSYHTRFPEYVHARSRIPLPMSYAIMRLFHAPSRGVMVATPNIRRDLEARGFHNLRDWTRGVDLELFHPDRKPALALEGPVYLYVGRIAVEKNISAFLECDLPGTKLLVGDGPQREELEARYPDALFVGAKYGEDLAAHYAAGDVFVFPSKTDTFGLVMLEAMATGLPVAAYPVAGPQDVVGDSQAGVLHENLQTAALEALTISPETAHAHAMTYSWKASAEQFLHHLHAHATRDLPSLPHENLPDPAIV